MNRIELVKSKFPLHHEAALQVEDPSGGKHKYLLWIAKQLANGHNSTDVSQTLKFFNENPDKFEKKDIHQYNDLKEVEDIVKEFGLSNTKAKDMAKEGGKKIFENDNLMVIRIDNKQAMMVYGSGTKWCTTMEDETYYEDYVYKGTNFYVIIRKVETALSSPKYAIAKKGLLEFQIYDAEDHYSRSFSETEEDILKDAICAVIGDKAPENYLNTLMDREKNIPKEEVLAWLKDQPESTADFIKQYRGDLKYIGETTAKLVDIFSDKYYHKNLSILEKDQILAIANEIKNKHKNIYINNLKIKLLDYLKDDERFVFENDPDHMVRAAVVGHLPVEKLKDYLKDNSFEVFKIAASKIDVQSLVEFIKKTRSAKKKLWAQEIFFTRINKQKLSDLIFKQIKDVLVDLLS